MTLDGPTITLRDYQDDAITCVLRVWTLPARRLLVALPIGMEVSHTTPAEGAASLSVIAWQ